MVVRQRAAAGALPPLTRALRRETPPLRRAFSLYDQINLIDNVPDDQLRFCFQEYGDTGFNVNGIKYEGSLLCIGNLLMSWSPKNCSEITVERYWYDQFSFCHQKKILDFILGLQIIVIPYGVVP